MKRALTCIFLSLALLTFLPYYGFSQDFVPASVEISTEKVNVNGTVFYVHKVLKGQTLYSISKAYNVSIDSITESNSNIKDGLKVGTLLYVPLTTHEVADNKVQPKNKDVVQQQLPDYKKYKKHTVKWYETIVDIANKYDVSVDDIVALNNLESTTLKKRQVIYIPDKNYKIIHVREEAADSTNLFPDTKKEQVLQPQPPFQYEFNHRRSYKISLVLPFAINQENGESANVNNMDFYSGVLMAMDVLKHDGKLGRMRLNVVNIEEYPDMDALISSGILDDSELIIGPITERDMVKVAQYAKANQIPIVSPMDTHTEHLALGNPYFFAFPPSPTAVIDNNLDSFTKPEMETGYHHTLIFERGKNHSKLVSDAVTGLQKRLVTYDTISYGILQGREIHDRMVKLFKTDSLNKIYVASDNEAFVSDVLRNIQMIYSKDSLDLHVFGQSKWKGFDNVELEHFHNLNVHLSLQYYIDYDNPSTKQFLSDYRGIFRTEPTPYSFQGYDITCYFISLLNEYGNEFPKYVIHYNRAMLQSNVRFEQIGTSSGFVNMATRNIEYAKDWQIMD